MPRWIRFVFAAVAARKTQTSLWKRSWQYQTQSNPASSARTAYLTAFSVGPWPLLRDRLKVRAISGFIRRVGDDKSSLQVCWAAFLSQLFS